MTNQAPPRTDLDQYRANVALVEAVERHDASWAHDELTTVGEEDCSEHDGTAHVVSAHQALWTTPSQDRSGPDREAGSDPRAPGSSG